MTVVVRNCPSPTGLLHIGTVRTALYNYLFAKKMGGKILFRSEDTDKERSTREYEKNIIEGLLALDLLDSASLNADHTPKIRQSERTEIYRKYLEELLENGHAYWCFCTSEELEAERKTQEAAKLPPRYSGKCAGIPLDEAKKRVAAGERAVIRLRVPQGEKLVFNDLIRGEIVTDSKEISDFVIAKNLENALYNFAVAIDDHEMGVTHVIRGEDHISNTPKQLLVYRAFGWETPQFAHLPLILNADRTKLSKRKNKVSMADFLEEGFLPDAVLNFLVLLGWNTADEQEIFTREELIEKFSLDRVHKGGAIFDQEKLEWMNGQYLKQLSIPDLTGKIIPYLEKADLPVPERRVLEPYVALVYERMKKLSEAPDFLRFLLVDQPKYDASLFAHEKLKVDLPTAKKSLEESLPVLQSIPENEWSETVLEERLVAKITELGWKNGQMLWPLRVALTGEKFSPGTFEVAVALGKERSIARIEAGIALLA